MSAFQTKKLLLGLFWLLLFSLAFNLRHIFNFVEIASLENFRERVSFSLYVFDIVFLLFALCFVFQKTKTLRKFGWPSQKYFWLVLFSFWILLNLAFHFNGFVLYNSFRILATLLFFFLASEILKDRQNFSRAVLVIFFSGIVQALIGIFQFLLQHSLGLKIFGESILAPQILGVAKFEWLSEKFIRAYGTFPHPNLFGAFLFLALLAFWQIKKLALFEKYSFWINSGAFLILLGILFSYSRTNYLITLIFALFLIWENKIALTRLFNQQRFIGFVFSILVFGFVFSLTFPRLCFDQCQGDNSVPLRKIYNQTAVRIIHAQPLWGVGIGNFEKLIDKYSPASLENWQRQPVHNFYLLVATETGIIGLVFLGLFFFNLLLKNTFNFWTLGLLLFLFLALFDHYFWTLPQGQFIFWLMLAFSNASSRIKEVQQ